MGALRKTENLPLTRTPRAAHLRSCALGVLFLIAAPLAGQTENAPSLSGRRPAMVVQFAEQAPRLDGVLDDACWQTAPPLTNFTQVLPVEGAPPSERTEARFVFTRDALFIAIRCFDREPRKIIATQMRRDHDFDSDDKIVIAFDTFNRQRDGYFFSVNPLGARTDGLIQNFSDRSYEWDTLWNARARVDELGWTVELEIPFKSLSFDPTRDAWGCNIERVIRRKQEVARWTSLSRAKSATALSDFGELRGLTELHQGIGLELRPFISLKYTTGTGGDDWDLKPGADVTYYITPSLKANATFNTDFAEAEVDERVINLTRFPTFFPEKRDFFLQDSSLFTFGGLGDMFRPYYSRRIGLSGRGQPVDILAGGRLTGRVGDTQIALLDVQQEAYDNVPSKNLFVGRVSTKVLDESNVGVIATHGDPHRPGDNTLLGVDFNYLNSQLSGGRQLVGHFWAMGTDSDRFESRDGAFGANVRFPNEPLSLTLRTRHIGEEFDPALGFVSRRGIRDYFAMADYTWRPNTAWLRSVSLNTRWNYFTDLDNRIIMEDHEFIMVTLTSPQGDEFWIRYGIDRDLLEEDFEIQPGIIIPPSDYWDGHIGLSLQTSRARPVSAEFEYRYGGFYTGNKQDFEWGLEWRVSRHFTTSAEYELTQVRLPPGNFDVHSVSWRLNVGFTPDLSWLTLVQYDNLSDDLGLNTRVRWTWRPGNDFFFVVNQGWGFDHWRFHNLQTQVAMKIGATFRF